MLLTLSLCVLVPLIVLLAFFKIRYRFWKKQGVPGPEPEIPFGCMREILTMKKTEAEVVQRASAQYKEAPVIGLFNLWKPVALINDPEMVKKLFFNPDINDHPPMLSDTETDFAFYSIFTMEGEVWKTRRAVFSKLFTPNHIRKYFADTRSALDQLVTRLEGEVDAESVCAFFTAQATLRLLHGLDISDDTVFTERLNKAVWTFAQPDFFTQLKVLTYTIFPSWLFRLTNMGVIHTSSWDFANDLFKRVMDNRQKAAEPRDDYLNMVIKLLTEGSPAFGRIDVKEALGHVFQILAAGTHTTAVTMSHVLFKLAEYPDVQEKVRNEVDSILNGEKFPTYEHLSEMSYLEAVINETMRVLPLVGVLKRTVKKDTEIAEGTTLKTGTDVWVDVNTQHRNPEAFPRPDEFLPERWFNGEADQNMFLAFGKGPRICIGMRMAEMEMKLLLATIISRFRIEKSSKTKVPFTFNPHVIIITNIPKEGIWVKLTPRS